MSSPEKDSGQYICCEGICRGKRTYSSDCWVEKVGEMDRRIYKKLNEMFEVQKLDIQDK
jgi:hypothetical protein